MGYPGYPIPPPPRSTADVTVAILGLVLTVLLGGASAVIGLFSLAFLDHCPPASCSVEGAVTAVTTALALAGLTGLTGTVLTIVALTRRKTAWPFAVGTLSLCIVVLFGGVIAYTAAVGG